MNKKIQEPTILPSDPTKQFEWFCDYVEGKINWYERKIRRKRAWSQFIRFFSIFLIVLAGLLPLFQNIIRDSKSCVLGVEIDKISSVGYIILAIAGGLNLMDRQIGLSSGYLRYVPAKMEIDRIYNDFIYQWYCKIYNQEIELNIELRSDLCELISRFKGQIDDEERRETDAWVSEFRTTQLELNSLLKAKTESYHKLIDEENKARKVRSQKNRKFVLIFDNIESFAAAILRLSKDGKKAIDDVIIDPIRSKKIVAGLAQGVYEIEIELVYKDETKASFITEEIVDLSTEKAPEIHVNTV